MSERPDLPREGPGGRGPAGEPSTDGGDSRAGLGPGLRDGAIILAAALLAVGSLLDLGQATDDFANAVGVVAGDSRILLVAAYTGALLGAAVGVGTAAVAVAVRRSTRWRAAGWAAVLVLALGRGLVTAPRLFGELGVAVRPASPPAWLLAADAVTGILAALLCLAAPPVAR